MPWFDPRLAVLALGFLGPPGSPAPSPDAAAVVVDVLDVFDEPDDRAIPTGRLERGDHVVIREEAKSGWLAIEPPGGSFDWIEQAAIRERPGGLEARVEVARALVRAGHPGARMPGAVRSTLTQGATVTLVDRPPLTLGQRRAARTWRAIAPGPDEVRYIRAEGVDRAPAAAPEPPAETRATFLAAPPPAALPPSIAAEVDRIESSHRALLRQPVEDWRLEPIRQRYEALLKQAADPNAAAAIRARLERVDRQQSVAESARKIEALLARCRSRERNLDLYLRRLDQAEQPSERPYDVEGMIHPSSRKVDGQKVFALIGPEGTPVAYLRLPAGLDPTPLLSRRVGVRGTAHYDELLRARLIEVQDLDPIDQPR